MKNRGIKTLSIPVKGFLIGLCLTSGNVLAQTLPLAGNLVGFNSPQGEQLLLDSKSREDYWPLSMQFVTQKNQAYCGVASSVMVLNALSIPAPEDPQYAPFRVFTQDNFFSSEKTKKVVPPEVVARKGMTLDQLGELLRSYAANVKVYHSADSSLAEFRQLASENLKQPGNFIIVNYLRKAIGQEKGGHISPIAAYNEQSDRFLILDVSRYKYPPVWVKAADLWRAMATLDSDSGKTRGFVLVSSPAQKSP